MKTDIMVDLFCGAGGTSTGAVQAADSLGKRLKLFAINHWEVAIETHSQNHPGAEHLCQSIDNVSPRGIFRNERIKLLCASPECTHHSNARGGRPRAEQSRAGAWQIIRWASELYIENILIENVPEFMSWGPLGANGQPLKSKKGAEFHAWINALKSLGYNLDYRVLNCADYGDPTTRRRFFLQAKRGRNRRITWPRITHTEKPDLFCEAWVSAESIIDWTIPAPSIFTRKRPLSENTLNRIKYGLEKYGGKEFLTLLYGTSTTGDLQRPLPTVTASGQHIALCAPFIVKRCWGSAAHSLTEPLPAVMTKQHLSFCAPFVIMNSWHNKTKGILEPLPTLTTRNNLSICQPFYIKYNGTGNGAYPLDKPLATVTTKDRFALVHPSQMDIGYRMLQPNELARAMSFPEDYKFTGTKTEIVKQIGNAVPVRTAQALVRELIA